MSINRLKRKNQAVRAKRGFLVGKAVYVSEKLIIYR